MNWLRPKIILTVAGIIIVLIVFSLAQEMNRRWQYQREVERLEGSVRELKKNVIELEHLNEYFSTEEYQERLAREKLNYRKDGEKVVLLPHNQTEVNESTPSQAGETIESSNPLLWWRVFFIDT